MENKRLRDQMSFVLDNSRVYYPFLPLRALRKKMLLDDTYLTVKDMGVGSKKLKNIQRRISDIANTSMKRRKYAEILFRLAEYHQFSNVLELGTSLGITTGYLASVSTKTHVTSIEGCPELAKVASVNLSKLGCKNATIIQGNFDEVVPKLLNDQKFDCVFIDGNHQEEATLKYFEWCISQKNNHMVLIFDDIHWSQGMENAWNKILDNKEITTTVDLFEMGIVYFDRELPVNNFKIR